MKFYLKNIFEEKRKKNIKILTVIIISLIISGIYIYNAQNYVIVRFDELGALTKNMPAFYNNFKIGRVVKIEPDQDFKHTLVKIDLFRKTLNLPQNTTVKVENFPNGDLYLQFVYPSSPSFANMKCGDMLEGTAPYSPTQFMLGQNVSGVADIVSLQIIKTLKAAETTLNNTSKLIQENRNAIRASTNNATIMTKNLAQTAQNLNSISEKLNYALDVKTLNNMSSNVENSTANIKDTTANILNATKDIDKTTKKIDNTISQANSVAENLNSITTGLNQTLSKKFGVMRIMFGTPVKSKNIVKNICY